MPFHIQNKQTGNFVEYITMSRKVIETSDISKAVPYPTFQHASYVVFWLLNHLEKWRIFDGETSKMYAHDGESWKLQRTG